MVQRHLAGLQGDVDGVLLVDLHRDLLPARQQVVLGEGVVVRNLVGCVPGTTRMLPLSGMLGVNATQAVTTSGVDNPQ